METKIRPNIYSLETGVARSRENLCGKSINHLSVVHGEVESVHSSFQTRVRVELFDKSPDVNACLVFDLRSPSGVKSIRQQRTHANRVVR